MSSTNFKKRVYFGFSEWGKWNPDDYNYSSVADNFRCDVGPEPSFVYAIYNIPSYEGSARIVFYRDYAWWTVYGSHCSCYGLAETGFDPEPFDPKVYFEGLAIGKNTLGSHLPWGEQGENPEATEAAFNTWLRTAMKRAK